MARKLPMDASSWREVKKGFAPGNSGVGVGGALLHQALACSASKVS